MKHYIYALLLLLSLVIFEGCEKENVGHNSSLLGKWEIITEDYIFNGKIVKSDPYQDSPYYLEFFDNGTYKDGSYVFSYAYDPSRKIINLFLSEYNVDKLTKSELVISTKRYDDYDTEGCSDYCKYYIGTRDGLKIYGDNEDYNLSYRFCYFDSSNRPIRLDYYESNKTTSFEDLTFYDSDGYSLKKSK